MKIEELIKKIGQEKRKAETEARDAHGLTRLQEVAAQYNGEYRLVWSDEVMEDIKNRPKKNLYPTNIKLLDDVIDGFRERQVISVAAQSSHGKSQWGLFLMEQMEELNPVMIPIEQDAEEIIEQRMDNGYSVPKFLSPSTLAPKVTVDWIEERVIEGIAKYNSKMVVVDHLGYVDTFGNNNELRRENLAFRIGQVMKGLKDIAKRWKVVIVLLVHISKLEESKPPMIEDIANSTDIKKESDMVMILWRKNETKNKVRIYSNKTMVSIQKNRRTGKNANIGLEFDTKTGRYLENHSWVESMVKSAEKGIEADDDFNDF